MHYLLIKDATWGKKVLLDKIIEENKYKPKTLKILKHGSVPKIHENLFVNKQKIEL